jgi:steroid 5-alpha reductase family enzyme
MNALIFVVGTLASSALLLTSGLPFASGLIVTVIVFTLLWLVSVALRDASIVDIFWGLGFVAIGWFYLATVPDVPTGRGWLVCSLVTLWGLRLALHIGIRNAGTGEDFRYRKWRENAGTNFWWISYFKVFLLQGVLLWIVSSPLILAQLDGPDIGRAALDVVAVVFWAVGFLFEVVADWQLMKFKREPANRGQILRSGLWSLSRHPNYFGEAVLWWGFGLLAFPTGGWLALLGPLMITFLLRRVSGVTMLDAALVDRRPGYSDYIRSTPAFFPLGKTRWWRSRRATRGA